jgi:excisionase family DNA binding protein
VEYNILQILTEIKDLLRDGRAQSSPWLSPEEAARYLGVSRTRIYQYIRADRIPLHRLPDSNMVRLNIHELDEWVKSGGEASRTISDETIRRLLK